MTLLDHSNEYIWHHVTLSELYLNQKSSELTILRCIFCKYLEDCQEHEFNNVRLIHQHCSHSIYNQII